MSREAIENLILAGDIDCLEKPKRPLLWELGILEHTGRDALMLDYPEYQVPLPSLTELEELSAEYRVQGLSARLHPIGYVVCRQAPDTAKGHVFLTLEDEEELLNIVLKPHVYEKYRYIVRMEPLLAVEGVLQKSEGIANIVPTMPYPVKEQTDSGLSEPKTNSYLTLKRSGY